MLMLIIYKELREILGSTKFAVTFGVCSLLIIFAFFTGAREYQIAQEEYDASTSENLRQLEGLTDWNEIEASSFQVFLPPQPLAALVLGVSNDMGHAIGINPDSPFTTFLSNDSRYSQHPVYAVFRFLDLEFVFQIILSLFAILFAYDAINGEKERGTLRLTFANSLPRATYIGGKIIGSFLALTIPLLVPILIGILLLPLMNIVLSSDEWLRLSLFVLSGFLYLGVFLTLSVLVSALTQHSSSAFLLLLVVWVFAVLVLPRASVLLAGNLIEVPQIEALDLEQVQLSKQFNSEINTAFSAYMAENMPQHAPDDDAGLIQSRMVGFQVEVNKYLNLLMDESTAEQASLSSRFYENRSNKQNEQRQLAFTLARISPAATFSFAATTLGGTSLGLKNYYIEQANAFQASYSNFISSKTGRESGPRISVNLGDYETEEELPKETVNLQEIPVFQYKQETLAEIVEAALPDIALLIFFNLIFFSGSFIAFLRYDLR